MFDNSDCYLDFFHFGEKKGESITKNSTENVWNETQKRQNELTKLVPTVILDVTSQQKQINCEE